MPATIAIIDGVLKVGLSQSELELMCRGENVAKISRRDLPVMCALGRTGATTVASTMIIASLAGIRACSPQAASAACTAAQRPPSDISADLQELRKTSVVVVCAGAKMIFGHRPHAGISGDDGRACAGPAHGGFPRVLLP